MKTKPASGTILIVDDTVENLRLLSQMLSERGYKIRAAKTGLEAIASVNAELTDLILLDIRLPDISGYEVCTTLKADEKTRAVPVVFLSALNEIDEKLRGFAAGGVDYITKPFISEEVLVRVQTHLEMSRLRSQLEIQTAELQSKNEQLEIEITERKHAAENLLESLTKLEAGKTASLNLLEDLKAEIDQRKQMEENLKFRNILLTTQQETSIDGILVINENGIIISYNNRFKEMWGISPEIIETKSGLVVLQSVLQQIVDPDQYSQKVHHLSIHTNETSHDEINFLDGRCFEQYSAPMTGSDAKYYGRVWYFHDLTSRKKSEEELTKYRDHLEELVKERTNELASERNLLRTLIDSLPDEIYAKNKDSRYIIANSNILRSFGLTNINEVIGKTDFEILPEKAALKYYSTEHSVLLAKGQIINYEESIPDVKGNLRWYSITKVPMLDDENTITGLVGINRDITYFKESEVRLEKAKIAAETANLAKSTFLSSMSHEIRTPMNAILGFSELMLYDKNLTKDQTKWIKTINRSGEHLLALINDILEVSRIEAGRIEFNPSGFNLHSMLRDIEAMFRIKTDAKKLTLLFDYSDDLPKYIVTDESKLRQIIINLAGIAVKFTKEGGVALRARVKQENDKMHFIAEVEDTGPGIAEMDVAKLFQKFWQAEAGIREGGTGLGLAISQQYAKIMGGVISVKSEEGKGTCFTLTIEIEDNKILVKEERKKKKVIGLKPGQKLYRILVSDDQADNRELLKIMLMSVGFAVEEAQNGTETIAKFKVWSPDLILMDMRMPVMDGYEATRSIKALENGKIPIIAVTASAFQEDRQKALEIGADGYLRKPFKEHELFECIEKCLGVQFVYE